MLGWFKKKFNKSKEAEPRPELEISPQETEQKILPPDDTPPSQPEPPPEPEPKTETETETETELNTESESNPAPEPKQAESADETPAPQKTGAMGSMFSRLSTKLSKTKESLVYRMDTLFLGKKEIDADLFDELEEILITADLGVSTTMELLDDARKRVKREALSDPAKLKTILKEKLRSFIMDSDADAELVMPKSGPFVIMVVGVNGVGKTTTIGKLAKKFKTSGQSVLLVAADTFRAAAVTQLQIWGERNGVDVVSQHEGADPSAVAFDAMERAVAEDYDVVIVDTAGRLHTQVNLMEELKKINRVMGKKLKGAPHEILLVLDATTGQNAISQAIIFNDVVTITGLALTKLDGTAKGGIVASICRELSIPIRFIGIGEQIDDLRDFDPDDFINALFGDDSYH
jgi:fused signal recognition particle receptor